ncbi:YmdB family metallophosphoesterase [Candidatus Nomurabacteria bacterium]|nr:YmdB family metallophosphoesterase [Candidatus Nomurabacteria bacterium]
MQNKTIKIIFFGDIVGSLGRKAVKEIVPLWQKEYAPDLMIANIENLAHGKGVTLKTVEEIKSTGIQLFSGGNHIWAKESIEDIAAQTHFPIALPANDSQTTDNYLWQDLEIKGQKIVLLSFSGRTFMKDDNLSNPFLKADELIKKFPDSIIIVDFHAEASSEKRAFGLYLDGRVSAVLGTHTHVPTNDAQILNQGTGYLTDIGMIGSYPSVIGVKSEIIINKFLSDEPNGRHEFADSGQIELNAVLLEVDTVSKKTVQIQNLRQILS